jgi:hypothetical protein
MSSMSQHRSCFPGASLDLSRRALYLPINISARGLRQRILRIAKRLGRDDLAAARELADQLDEDERSWPLEEGGGDPLLRARVLARVFLDLHELGWEISLEGRRIFAVAPSEPAPGDSLTPAEIIAEKERLRRAVFPRIAEQLRTPKTRRLVRTAEDAGVQRLFAHGSTLAAALEEQGPEAIRPYLQPARGHDGVDQTTGLRLHTIYRYMRLTWSLPYGDTPGRRLPILIRDAGQPGHPVCGLLCLSSPVPRLTARDTRLGLSSGWVEAVIAALCLPIAGDEPYPVLKQRLQAHLVSIHTAAAERSVVDKRTPTPAVLMRDLVEILGLEAGPDPRKLARQLAARGAGSLRVHLQELQRTLARHLIDEIQGGVSGFSFEGLPMTEQQAFASPERFLPQLGELGEAAQAKRTDALEQVQRAKAAKDGDTVTREKERARKELFEKKRAYQLTELLKAWAAAAPVLSALEDREHPERLREALVDALDLRSGELCGGERANRFVKTAVSQRRTRLMAAQVADVSLCGALPPYQDLLGGKLAAMLALSREAAMLYFASYDGQISQIQTEHAGEDFSRPAELLALTTTSLYGVGSTQYNRLRLPKPLGGIRWELVGHSSGYGTLQFSRRTTALMERLLTVETGRQEINSEFGEGPSPKLRKLREGLKILGLPEAGLLKHGMHRLVYVAELAPGARPGVDAARAAHHRSGATSAEIVAHWRERWLRGRLKNDSERRRGLCAFLPEQALLSRVYPQIIELSDVTDGEPGEE